MIGRTQMRTVEHDETSAVPHHSHLLEHHEEKAKALRDQIKDLRRQLALEAAQIRAIRRRLAKKNVSLLP